jgi:hypothetical protein
LLAAIPRLNFDAVIELALHLSFEAQLNDKAVWQAIEEAALKDLHLYDTRQLC